MSLKNTKTKNFITSLLFVTITILAVLNFAQMVSALDAPPPTNTFAGLGAVGDELNKNGGLPTNFVGRGVSTATDGTKDIEAIILTVVDLLKYFIYGLALFFAFFQGFKLVIAGKDIESYQEEATKNIKYSLMAIVIVFLADTLIRKVFFPDSGAVFENGTESVDRYGKYGIGEIRGLYTTMEYIAGAVGVLVIIISGIGYTLSAGNEDSMKKNQNRILWAAAGLFIISIAEFVIKDILFPDLGTKLPNISKGMLLIKSFTNFMSGFVSTISFGLMLYAGYLYISGGVNEEGLAKAKKAIIAGVVGILLSLGAFGLVSTLIKTDSSPLVAPIGAAPAGVAPAMPASLTK